MDEQQPVSQLSPLQLPVVRGNFASDSDAHPCGAGRRRTQRRHRRAHTHPTRESVRLATNQSRHRRPRRPAAGVPVRGPVPFVTSGERTGALRRTGRPIENLSTTALHVASRTFWIASTRTTRNWGAKWRCGFRLYFPEMHAYRCPLLHQMKANRLIELSSSKTCHLWRLWSASRQDHMTWREEPYGGHRMGSFISKR